MAIELPDDLIELERSAWTEIQAGTLTLETAAAVQARVTVVAAELGENRYDVEQALKRAVRHPEPEPA
ncbi:hypothetical protein [Streptomyces odontomachi]|uniref:hypothetical protein n=1 Tax=Streptomyces odontomachi TaxID=2944940 RepID=UPI0021096201|nr:hypothetical protein [Streptomyces sp. ODS25]